VRRGGEGGGILFLIRNLKELGIPKFFLVLGNLN
jgi:hypothetical protein